MSMTENDLTSLEQEMFHKVQEFRQHAYAPYSNFFVGAVLLTKEGKIYGGCNVENRSFSMTMCAERNAIFNAISEGERNFESIMILASDHPVMPCGACLQVMAEFHIPKILLATLYGNFQIFTFDEFLPHAFAEKDMTGDAKKFHEKFFDENEASFDSKYFFDVVKSQSLSPILETFFANDEPSGKK